MPRSPLHFALAIAAAMAACGGGDAQLPPADAPPADAAPSDGAPGFAACSKFDGPALSVPAHATGAIAGADLEAPAHCAIVDAAFGVESAGPDSVVHVTGLVPGAPYVVHLASAADLAFYVATGCDTATGPSSADCLLFEDDSSGHIEVGGFTAPGPDAYIVVDYYQSTAPADGSFTLDVYAEECAYEGNASPDTCNGATPACLDGRCVACASSFDCTDPALSVCDTGGHVCVAGANSCASDDPREPADDGPAGAPVLTCDANGHASISGSMCAAPLGESDYIAFQVADLGDTWELQLGWSGNRDLDLEIFDAHGDALGLSYWDKPEHIELTYLPLGTYYARVSEYSTSTDATPVAYTVTAQRYAGPGCTVPADCAAETRNQIFRGACTGGACVPIDADGTVAQGGACDSDDDCAAGLSCPSFYFVADADTREICEPNCAHDSDCAALGSGFVCTTYLSVNECVLKCTDDDQCPTDLDAQPTSGPWARLSCDVPSGRCLP